MLEDKFQLKLKEENITISSSADSTEKCSYNPDVVGGGGGGEHNGRLHECVIQA